MALPMIGLMLLVLLPAFLMFDRLVRIEYEDFRGSWEADGKPHGFFWVPNEIRRFHGLLISSGSGIARQRCALSWLVLTPKWVRENRTARRAIFVWRFLVGFWILANLALAFLALR